MKTKLTIFAVISLLSSCTQQNTSEDILLDIIKEYNDSIGIKVQECVYYNIMVEVNGNDTVLSLEGQPFEHYWNFLPPPPPPDSPEEEIDNITKIRFLGPVQCGKDSITFYFNEEKLIEYVEMLIGNNQLKTDSIHIQEHRCKFNYEPRTMRISLRNRHL